MRGRQRRHASGVEAEGPGAPAGVEGGRAEEAADAEIPVEAVVGDLEHVRGARCIHGVWRRWGGDRFVMRDERVFVRDENIADA